MKNQNILKNILLFKEQKFDKEEPVRKKGHFFSRKKLHFDEKNNNNTIDNININRITDIGDDKDKIILWNPQNKYMHLMNIDLKKIDFIKRKKILTKR